MKLRFPLPNNISFVLTQSFQEHLEAARKMNTKYNGGADWAPGRADAGQKIPVLAAAGGTVVRGGWDATGYGNSVQIQHPENTRTLYAHLEKILVGVSEPVSAGQIIGYMGSTGNSTGKHLHFEVIVNGLRVDPMAYVTQRTQVEPPEAGFSLPAFPELPAARVISGIGLRVRSSPSGAEVGYLGFNDVVPVFQAEKRSDGSIWVCIGYKQWCAALYQGETYLAWEHAPEGER